MNKKPKVSVIVPIYNVEKYLKRCIDSLLNQTLKEIEIILINDGSTDNCDQICNSYSEKYNRIQVVHKKNSGLSEARNHGLKYAKGEFILFVDSDDWCESYMIEKLYNAISINNNDIAVCGYYIDYTNNNFSINKTLEEAEKYNERNILSDSIFLLDRKGMFNTVWNKLYKKSIIASNKIKFEIDGMPGEDLLFNCEYFRYVKSITLLNDILYHYMREDEDTLVSKYREDLYNKIQIFNKARRELYDYYKMNSPEEKECYANSYIGYINSCINNIYRKSSNLSCTNKKEVIKSILSNDEINIYIKEYAPKDVCGKLFKILYKLNSINIMYLVYLLLFNLRYNFDALYRKYRKYILLHKG